MPLPARRAVQTAVVISPYSDRPIRLGCRQDQQSDSGRMKSQHDPAGSAHSSPLTGRRRMPAAAPRGQQQVLVTEENLSDKEVYPSGYMAIPQIGERAEATRLRLEWWIDVPVLKSCRVDYAILFRFL